MLAIFTLELFFCIFYLVNLLIVFFPELQLDLLVKALVLYRYKRIVVVVVDLCYGL